MSHDSTSKPAAPSAAQPDGRRRRFLGAGAAVTPAVLTLASQPALGVTCFTPSRSLSRNTSISQQDNYGTCTNAQSPGNYQAQQDPSSNSYSWPRTPVEIPPTTPFYPTFKKGSLVKFTTGNGANSRSMTLGEVLNLNGNADPGQVAFHLIGAYLNINGGTSGGVKASISPLAADTSRILNIWAEWADKGYYEPFAGTKWYAEQIVTYLKSNGIVA